MSKYHKIRWNESDDQELKRVVRNFNAKLKRLEKKDPQKYNKNTKGTQLALWAGKLSFEHPTTKNKMTFVLF